MSPICLVALGISFLSALLIHLFSRSIAGCEQIIKLDEYWPLMQIPKIFSGGATLLCWWVLLGPLAGLISCASSLLASGVVVTALGKRWPTALWPAGCTALLAVCIGSYQLLSN